MSLQNHWLRALTWAFVTVACAAVLVVIFQAFMRYRYETLGGVLWRVDQLTNQRCRVLTRRIVCSAPASTSTSVSTSTSTSTSVSTAAVAARRPAH